MNDIQLAELRELQSLLFEAVKVDCDPRNWSGHGKTPKEMTREERGGRSFDLKNADKSIGIFARATNIINTHSKPTEGNIKEDEDLQRDIDKVKDQAQDLLKQVREKEQAPHNVH